MGTLEFPNIHPIGEFFKLFPEKNLELGEKARSPASVGGPRFSGFYERFADAFCVCGAGGSKPLLRFSPPRPLFFTGRPVPGVKWPPTFLARGGLRPAFGEKLLFDCSVSIGRPAADPMLTCARSSLHPLAFGRVRRPMRQRFVSLQPCALGTKCLRRGGVSHWF